MRCALVTGSLYIVWVPQTKLFIKLCCIQQCLGFVELKAVKSYESDLAIKWR